MPVAFPPTCAQDCTHAERSLLLFLEEQSYKSYGRFIGRELVKADFEMLERWKTQDFIDYGPLVHVPGYWVTLSNDAWRVAGELRKWWARVFIEEEEKIHPERSIARAKEAMRLPKAAPESYDPRACAIQGCPGPADSCEHALRS